ncbi:MAG: hypothetical protein AAB448_05125 [Patescibacteria group bacterium]
MNEHKPHYLDSQEPRDELAPDAKRVAWAALFSMIIHGVAFHHNEAKAIVDQLQTGAGDVVYDLQGAPKGALARARSEVYQKRHSESFDSTSESIVQYLDSESIRDVDLSQFFAFEEWALEGASVDYSEANDAYHELLSSLKDLRDSGASMDEVFNHLLVSGGKHEKGQSSLFVLVKEGRGNCQARAKLYASAIEDLYPDLSKEGKIELQVFRSWKDVEGKRQLGHVRVVIDEAENWLVVEGDQVEEMQKTTMIPTYEAHEAFLKGTAIGLDLVVPSKVGYPERNKSFFDFGARIVYPPSDALYEGDGQSDAPELSATKRVPKVRKYFSAPDDYVPTILPPLSDSQVARHATERLEHMEKLNALKSEFQALVEKVHGEVVLSAYSLQDSLLLPLSLITEGDGQRALEIEELLKKEGEFKYKEVQILVDVEMGMIPEWAWGNELVIGAELSDDDIKRLVRRSSTVLFSSLQAFKINGRRMEQLSKGVGQNFSRVEFLGVQSSELVETFREFQKVMPVENRTFVFRSQDPLDAQAISACQSLDAPRNQEYHASSIFGGLSIKSGYLAMYTRTHDPSFRISDSNNTRPNTVNDSINYSVIEGFEMPTGFYNAQSTDARSVKISNIKKINPRSIIGDKLYVEARLDSEAEIAPGAFVGLRSLEFILNETENKSLPAFDTQAFSRLNNNVPILFNFAFLGYNHGNALTVELFETLKSLAIPPSSIVVSKIRHNRLGEYDPVSKTFNTTTLEEFTK